MGVAEKRIYAGGDDDYGRVCKAVGKGCLPDGHSWHPTRIAADGFDRGLAQR